MDLLTVHHEEIIYILSVNLSTKKNNTSRAWLDSHQQCNWLPSIVCRQIFHFILMMGGSRGLIAASEKICFNEPTSPSAQGICNILLQEHIFSSTKWINDQKKKGARSSVSLFSLLSVCSCPPQPAVQCSICKVNCGRWLWSPVRAGAGVIDTCHIVIILGARNYNPPLPQMSQHYP